MLKFFIKLFLLFCLFDNGLDAQNRFDLQYPQDPFSQEALLDLRYLNEAEAGASGFVSLSADGGGFVIGNGQPIRFWSVNGGSNASRNSFRPMDDQQLARFARFLSKKGVNMIRYHGRIFSISSDINQTNRDEIEDIWRVVAAMKKEGIYTTISPYWPGHVQNIPASWDLGDYTGEVQPWGLLFFAPKLQNAYKNWVNDLYTEVNPHTGLALKDDPAVAIIQVQNEDGVFFWTIQDVKPSLLKLMEEGFYQWLLDKYGSIPNAYTAWEQVNLTEDNPANGRMGLYIIWEATQEQSGGKEVRINDQIAYYSAVQRDFYQQMYDHYRSMGCQQLINTANWKTADPVKLFDAERWTNTVGEVMAVNRYYDPQHIGPNNGWRIEPDHQYVGNSVLFNPDEFPINVKQVMGKPFMVTESGWNLPHKYQAEGPFLISCYMSLTGFDSYYWFSPSSPGIDPEPYWDFANINGQTPMFRWTVSTPGQLDMFPANALMFRKGYIKQGEVMVHEERTLQSVTGRELPVISEENGFDPNRDDPGLGGGGPETLISPLAYLTGPVEVVYQGDPDATSISPALDQSIDAQSGVVNSATGELTWDYLNGICLLDAPAAKGLCGFPGNTDEFQLTDVTIKTTDEYIAVNLVAMDDQPIKDSGQILIQVGTVYRPTNWSEESSSFEFGDQTVEGYRINNVGRMPWQGIRSNVSITLTNANVRSAHVLDQNGYKRREVQVEWLSGDSKRITIPGDAMYLVLNTDDPGLVTALHETQLDSIKVYPNPTTGMINLEIPMETDYSELEILDLHGRQMGKWAKQPGVYQLNLPQGIYILKVQKENEIQNVSRLIVKP